MDFEGETNVSYNYCAILCINLQSLLDSFVI